MARAPLHFWEWDRMTDAEFASWLRECDGLGTAVVSWKRSGAFKTVLDVGTGLGGNARLFARHGFDVSALDADANAINAAKHYSESLGLNIDFRVGDMRKMPYKAESFDFVLGINIFSLTDTDGMFAAVSESNRVLKPGGHVFMTLLDKESYMFNNAPRIDANTIMARPQYGSKKVPYCLVDDEVVSDLMQEFDILSAEKSLVGSIAKPTIVRRILAVKQR